MTQPSSLPTGSRSAHAAIAGYEYQFDKTALSLLTAADTDVVQIEGIEDIDLHTLQNSEAVQVKYFADRPTLLQKACVNRFVSCLSITRLELAGITSCTSISAILASCRIVSMSHI